MRKTDIVLTDVRKGDLLCEVARAFLHSGNPSALLSHLQNGVDYACLERESDCDKKLLRELSKDIADLVGKWKAKEDEL